MHKATQPRHDSPARTGASLFARQTALAVGLLALGIFFGSSSPLHGQIAASPAKGHYLLDARMPPGMVAHAQVAGGRPGVGTFTAVSIMGPQGLRIGLAQAGQFLSPIEAPVTTGMLVGSVYRFHVTHIPGYPGQELFPTLEVIDRVHTQPGREHRFPIPVALTEEDLQLALQGALITRVIYLEDSSVAEPIATNPQLQLTIEASPQDNALRVADQLGRPVAILRIGSRIPMNLSGDITGFLFGCPPWVPLPVAPDVPAMVEQGHLPGYLPSENPNPLYPEEPIESVPRIR
jgi:hypothetical protein